MVFIDLDCRLDVSRLSQVLKLRILEANGNGELFISFNINEMLISRLSSRAAIVLKDIHNVLGCYSDLSWVIIWY